MTSEGTILILVFLFLLYHKDFKKEKATLSMQSAISNQPSSFSKKNRDLSGINSEEVTVQVPSGSSFWMTYLGHRNAGGHSAKDKAEGSRSPGSKLTPAKEG